MKCIIRTEHAGVFYAEVAERRGSEADLVNARRIWSWEGATECIGIAVNGLDPHSSRLTILVPSMTVMGVLEIIPCSQQSQAIIEGARAWTV